MKQKYSERALAVAPSTTLEITARAAELKNSGADLISFGAGEPDFDTPAAIKQAAIEAIEGGFTKYTATAGIPALRQALADKLKRDNNLEYAANQIIVTNGGKQAIYNALQAILNPGEEVILFAPYWLSYPEMIKMAGGQPVVLPTCLEEKYLPDLAKLKRLITPKTKAILFNSPCNPTGAVYPEEVLRGLAELAVRHDLWVLSDEIYEKLVYNGKKHISIASLGEDIFQRTIVLNGYAAGEKEVIAIMTRLQSHQTSNVNSITQKAALAAFSSTEFPAMYEAFDKRRQFMVNYLRSIPQVRFAEPDGAFYVLLDVREFLAKRSITAAEMAKDLLEKQFVAVVPADDFGISGHIRLSYPIDTAKIEVGLSRLKKYLQG